MASDQRAHFRIDSEREVSTVPQEGQNGAVSVAFETRDGGEPVEVTRLSSVGDNLGSERETNRVHIPIATDPTQNCREIRLRVKKTHPEQALRLRVVGSH